MSDIINLGGYKNHPNFQIIVSDELKNFGAPQYESISAAGLDLRSLACSHEVGKIKGIILQPGETAVVSTGLKLWIRDPNFVGIVHVRSSVGTKRGIVLAHGTGVIDADYQGEIVLPLWNRTELPQSIEYGERVAQILIMPVLRPYLTFVDRFSAASERGDKGFGSTGRGVA